MTSRWIRTVPSASTLCVAMPSDSSVFASVAVRTSAAGGASTPRSGSVWSGRAGSISAEAATAPAISAAHSGIEVGEVEISITTVYGELRPLP